MEYLLIGSLLSFASKTFAYFYLVILKIFGFTKYNVHNDFDVIISNLADQSLERQDNKMSGFIFGYPYFGYIEYSTERGKNNMWIITTKKFYEKLTVNKTTQQIIDSGTCDQLKIINRSGAYNSVYYFKSTIYVNLPDPRPKQENIIDKIFKTYEQKKIVTCFIHGDPGTGKSMISLIIAKKLKGTYCNNYDFTEPGTHLQSLYTNAKVSDENPLIVAIDEFDILIANVHRGIIKPHKNARTEVKNKGEYNNLLDSINLGIYRNLIIVFTSNVSAAEINKMDTSYLRPGRVDLICKM